jgi:hypothetical protein
VSLTLPALQIELLHAGHVHLKRALIREQVCSTATLSGVVGAARCRLGAMMLSLCWSSLFGRLKISKLFREKFQ